MTEDPKSSTGSRDNWRVASREPLEIRCWDGDYVVYNPLSGQTHFLEILTGHVLAFIVAEAPSSERIRAEISSFLDLQDEEPVARQASSILYLLERSGLIERAA